MRKALFIFTLFVLISSRSFASWQDSQSWYINAYRSSTEGQVENTVMYANINAYCDFVKISGYIGNLQSGGYLDISVDGNNSSYREYITTDGPYYIPYYDFGSDPYYFSTLTLHAEAYAVNASLLFRWGQY